MPRKIRLIDSNAKCRYLTKIDLQRDFAGGVLSETPSPSFDPIIPHTVYVYTVYLFTHGRGRAGERYPERRLEGQ
jgi:hypothetical protein